MKLGVITVLYLLQSPVLCNLCTWMQATRQWTGGVKIEMLVDIQEEAMDWNITMEFGEDVKSLEAWRAQVMEHSSSVYSLTSKCYNGNLYPCQCLEIGFLVRFACEQTSLPSSVITFNGVPAPPCLGAPLCNGPGAGCNNTDSLCPGSDQVCNIPGYGNCAWCQENTCVIGCASDSNCPPDRPVCGAGLMEDSSDASGSGGGGDQESHRCGCTEDSQCMTEHICEDRVCVPGCRADTGCIGQNQTCSNPGSQETCTYCNLGTCDPGCSGDSNCANSTAVCSPPNHLDCHYCSQHSCTNGCSTDSNCPDLYPVCGGGGDHLCGCNLSSDCRSGYFCGENHKCVAPPGKVLVREIKLYTTECSGCTREGSIVFLLGERNSEYPNGVPCQTRILDIQDTMEYVSTSDYGFTDETLLGSCFEGPLNSQIKPGGNVTWVGDGIWSPRRQEGVCVDWTEDSAWAWVCDLDGPPSGGSGTMWNLINCDIVFSVSCPPWE